MEERDDSGGGWRRYRRGGSGAEWELAHKLVLVAMSVLGLWASARVGQEEEEEERRSGI